MATLVEEESTSACQTIQSTTSIKTGFSRIHICMALNMKWHQIVLLRTNFMTTTPHVPCVTSSHEQLSWWYPQGMTVPPVGPRSTMGTWWQIAITTSTQPVSFALMGRQSLFTAVTPTTMGPFCTSWKDSVVRYHAFRMLQAESWHVLCAPNESKEAKQTTFAENRSFRHWLLLVSKSSKNDTYLR